MENNSQEQLNTEAAQEEDLVKLYDRNARIFAAIGIVLLFGGIAGVQLTPVSAHTGPVIAAIIGFLLALFGLGNLQMNAKVRAFSQLVMRAPENHAAAAGLLSILEGRRMISLTPRASSALGNAVAVYRISPQADPEIADKLTEICREHVKTSII